MLHIVAPHKPKRRLLDGALCTARKEDERSPETPIWNRFAIDTDLLLMLHHGMGSHQFTVHECGGAETLIDVDRVFSNNSDIRSAAVDIAREMMAKEIGFGRLCLTCWIVVTNEYGHNVMTLHFGDAIKMVDHDSCSASKASESPGEETGDIAAAASR